MAAGRVTHARTPCWKTGRCIDPRAQTPNWLNGAAIGARGAANVALLPARQLANGVARPATACNP
eukprot:11203455-Lingulodinium_polyedra.AAC.1